MKRLTLNLSKMKKVASDKKTTNLKHEDGHIIVILHSALPAIQRKALEKLPIHEEEPKKMAAGGVAINNPFSPVQVSSAGPQVQSGTPAIDLGDWGGPKSKPKEEKTESTSTGDSGLDIKLNSAFNNAQTAGEAAASPAALSTAFDNAMAEGGEVKKEEKKDKPNYGKVTVKEDPKPNNFGSVKFSKKYAEGGEVFECEHCGGMTRKNYDEGGKTTSEPTDAPEKNMSEPTDTPAQPQAPVVVNVHNSPAPGTQTIPAIANAPAQAANTAPIQTQQAPTATYGTAGGITTPAQNEKLAEQQLQEAGKENVGIQSEEAKLAAERAKGTIQGIKEIQDQRAANVAEVQKPVQDFAEHLSQNPVDGNRYLNQMSEGKKIRTAIGLFLGGLSVPFGGQNTTLDMLNKAIDRDVDAQKQNTENKKSLYNAYFHLYGNKDLAANQAKQSLLDVVAQQANIDAARLGTPKAINNNKVFQANAAQAKYNLSQQAGALLPGAKAVGAQKSTQNPQEIDTTKTPNMEKANEVANKMKNSDLEKEKDMRPGSPEAPYIPEPELVKVDYNAINTHKRNRELGILNAMTPEEIHQADEESKQANAANIALKEIHKQYETMWKNGGDQDFLAKFLKGQSIFGAHLPDLSQLTPSQRAYYTAASAVEKQLNQGLKGGLGPSTAGLIEDQLPHKGDTPEQFREKLRNVDNIIRQPLGGGVLERRGLAKGLPK